VTGVRAVLVDKIKGRPAWSPDTLKDVNDADILGTFFHKFSPENGTAPSISLSNEVQFEPSNTASPMLYALPTENEIRQLVTGSHQSSGGTSLTKDELIQKLEKLRRGKMGIREKVAEVVSRRCVEEGDKVSGTHFLKWRN
jgi:3-hydroxyisobutyryl-CoA hydrolase